MFHPVKSCRHVNADLLQFEALKWGGAVADNTTGKQLSPHGCESEPIQMDGLRLDLRNSGLN